VFGHKVHLHLEKRGKKKIKKNKKEKKDKKEKKEREKEKREKEKQKEKESKKQKKTLEDEVDSDLKKDEISVWVEKKAPTIIDPTENNKLKNQIGPLPLSEIMDQRTGGDINSQMMPGEGDAIASFVKQNKRIPRRGEVGITHERIEALEGEGFVMSGNRHKKMNAIRLRKENQVYNVEERKLLNAATMVEKSQREQKIVNKLKEVVDEKLRSDVI